MKCVRSIATGRVMRLSESAASRAVKAGGEFVPKHVWKEEVRDAGK